MPARTLSLSLSPNFNFLINIFYFSTLACDHLTCHRLHSFSPFLQQHSLRSALICLKFITLTHTHIHRAREREMCCESMLNCRMYLNLFKYILYPFILRILTAQCICLSSVDLFVGVLVETL